MSSANLSALERFAGRIARWVQRKVEPWALLGDARYCPVCRSSLDRFEPMPLYFMKQWTAHGYTRSPFAAEMLNLMEFSCPRCGASDRSRLYAHFFAQTFAKLPSGGSYRFIDFAPSPPLSRFLRGFKQLEYRTADLFMEGVDDQVDLCDLGIYGDETVDYFLCSHILEHVPDDRRALRELRRILKQTGLGVLIVPIDLSSSEIDEDPTLTDVAERWRRFGQDDHVRNYSKSGWLSRVEEAGFSVEELGIDHFGAGTFEKLGLVDRSILYVVRPKRHSA